MEIWHKIYVFFSEPSVLAVAMMLVGLLVVVGVPYRRMFRLEVEKTQMQSDYLKRCIEAQEEERARIAADLHDSIISKLTVVRLSAMMKENYDQLDGLLNETIEEGYHTKCSRPYTKKHP